MSETTTYTCRICGQPLGGEAALDPDPPEIGKTSYLHPHCGEEARTRVNNRLARRKQQLQEAAPALLAACKMAVQEMHGSRDSISQLMAAIARAEKGSAS